MRVLATSGLGAGSPCFLHKDPQPWPGRCVRESFGQGLTGWRWPRPGPCRVWWVMQGEGAARAQSRGLAAAVDLRHDESPRTLGARSPLRQRAAPVTFRRCARHQWTSQGHPGQPQCHSDQADVAWQICSAAVTKLFVKSLRNQLQCLRRGSL